MKIPDSDLQVEFLKGQGKGGQRKNKVETACRITHLPTGITAFADTRFQNQSKREAMDELHARLEARAAEEKTKRKRARRDEKVRTNETPVRTYHFVRDVVKDHRTGKKASIKDILDKGKLDLLK